MRKSLALAPALDCYLPEGNLCFKIFKHNLPNLVFWMYISHPPALALTFHWFFMDIPHLRPICRQQWGPMAHTFVPSPTLTHAPVSFQALDPFSKSGKAAILFFVEWCCKPDRLNPPFSFSWVVFPSSCPVFFFHAQQAEGTFILAFFWDEAKVLKRVLFWVLFFWGGGLNLKFWRRSIFFKC